MTIHQHSDKLITNWQSFSIGQDASVTFKQPGSGSVALNRVTGQSPSQILGRLNANGHVMLINPSGILFGPHSQVNVGAITASALNISDQAFLEGRYQFKTTNPSAELLNQGVITAHSGHIALLSPIVRNEGQLRADQNSILLGAADALTLDFYGDGLAKLKVDKAKLDSLIENRGVISADGGLVMLSTDTTRELMTGAVNNSGIIQARSLSLQDGRIILEGGNISNSGTLNVAGAVGSSGGNISVHGQSVTTGGTLSAYGASGGSIRVDATQELRTSANYQAKGDRAQGGEIDLSADSVSLLNSTLDASGHTQGGKIRIGGSFQGGKPVPANDLHPEFRALFSDSPPLQNASNTFINDESRIDASASNGSGGAVVIWSNQRTTQLGSIDTQGMKGGFIEISSARELQHVEFSRLMPGPSGTLLLDPKEIEIGLFPNSNNANPQSGLYGYAEDSGQNSKIDNIELQTLLASGSDVILQASNNITVNAPINVDNPYGDGGNLSLHSGGGIIIDASINSDNGDLTFIANDHATSGVIDSDKESHLTAIILMEGGFVTLNAGTGNVYFELRTGEGLSSNDFGSIIIDRQSIIANSITVITPPDEQEPDVPDTFIDPYIDLGIEPPHIDLNFEQHSQNEYLLKHHNEDSFESIRVSKSTEAKRQKKDETCIRTKEDNTGNTTTEIGACPTS
ncbi:filamentous hemagglutinin N-terminal domain-containing protein [Dongshaea marina]|uniref:filamentous hemagglutinin N-terminal domain-containing protein n=1 Tax=Dongshaea marina TaxID=2047966 RepID=UPI001F331C09|nr:filamentous hemagglutinin N-terminal domain-containing protein [Dongshaea marina]